MKSIRGNQVVIAGLEDHVKKVQAEIAKLEDAADALMPAFEP
jgi:hypothetical protein